MITGTSVEEDNGAGEEYVSLRKEVNMREAEMKYVSSRGRRGERKEGGGRERR